MADNGANTTAPGIIGTKVGITQMYDDNGALHAVTIVKTGPCVVVQRKGQSTDGYAAVQIGLVDEKRASKHLKKPAAGHFKKAGVAPVRVMREIRLESDEAHPELTPGAELTCANVATGTFVDVIGTSKGKGFQGVMKRHGFSGGRASHGSMFHRAPGSIGAAAYPSRVYKGTRLPGQMGNVRVTVKNLPVLRIEPKDNLVFLRGSVPGSVNSVVLIRPSRTTRKAAAVIGGGE